MRIILRRTPVSRIVHKVANFASFLYYGKKNSIRLRGRCNHVYSFGVNPHLCCTDKVSEDEIVLHVFTGHVRSLQNKYPLFGRKFKGFPPL